MFNLMMFILLFHFCGDAFAEAGQKFTENGYYIDVSVDQMGKRINIRGDISGGKDAKKLKIKFKIADSDGNRKAATVVINDYRGHERFSTNEPKCGLSGTRWRVSEIIIY